MNYRIARVNSLLKEEVSKIILEEVDFNGAIITIIDVETSSDLSYAKIKISVYPEEKKINALKKINDHIFKIQRIINKRLKMKFVPKIIFEFV